MSDDEAPFVSILIAARNEEHTLPGCLEAIEALHYPTHRLEILIGDDASTDQTAAVAQLFINRNQHIRLISISLKYPNLNGKANVLAQLAQQARGSFLLTTDADARVSPGWVRAMLEPFLAPPQNRPVGVANGVSTIVGNSLWARVQATECLLVFQWLALAARWQIPVTGVGNNMAIRREAYEAVGGFEGQPFSVVEDYTLFQAIVKQGYGFAQPLNPGTLVGMLPLPTLSAYLQQRKRWMKGVFSLPFSSCLLALTQYLAGPLLLLLSCWLPAFALPLYGGKLLAQSLLVTNALIRLRQKHLWFSALLLEPYQLITGPLALLYYWLPTGITWKGRQYESARSL